MNLLDQNILTETVTNLRTYQGGFFKTLISPSQTDGNMTLMEMTLPKGVEPPMHIHTKEDESFYLLDGEMTFHIGDEVIHARKGEAIFAPRMIPHSFQINTTSAKFLTLITPGYLLNYFLEFSEPQEGEPQLIHPEGPPPMEIIQKMTQQLTEKYGVRFA
nr:cupin domain-containing protein [Pedobacter panaciterrae]